ncbi:hypothetical protein C7B61_05650 [filamentous cyanobacterium CCP1]|nr:hypothetical protein C7B61_05650 [filamentous cyanobacterium CCP1]
MVIGALYRRAVVTLLGDVSPAAWPTPFLSYCSYEQHIFIGALKVLQTVEIECCELLQGVQLVRSPTSMDFLAVLQDVVMNTFN